MFSGARLPWFQPSTSVPLQVSSHTPPQGFLCPYILTSNLHDKSPQCREKGPRAKFVFTLVSLRRQHWDVCGLSHFLLG